MEIRVNRVTVPRLLPSGSALSASSTFLIVQAGRREFSFRSILEIQIRIRLIRLLTVSSDYFSQPSMTSVLA